MLKKSTILLLVLAPSIISSFKIPSFTFPLRIMTFNTWLSGGKVEDGVSKLAKHISINNPDIVSLQEVKNTSVFDELLDKLGPPWIGYCHENSTYPNVGIITRHIIDNSTLTFLNSTTAMGCNVNLQAYNFTVSFWAIHLDHHSYGPYAAQNKLVTRLDQILAGEKPRSHNGRVDNILELLGTPNFQAAIERSILEPIFVSGDFNTPSHLDWIEKNKNIHGDWTVQWPATFLLQNSTGLIDSYRKIFPDPIKNPGNTWSAAQKFGWEWDFTIPEPQDRIDFIYFKGPKARAINSFLYSGSEKLEITPNQAKNDYPSDHYAVISDFLIASEIFSM